VRGLAFAEALAFLRSSFASAQAMNYRDVIFKGATRPATMAGVPVVPFILVVGLHILVCMWTVILIGLFAATAIALSCVVCVLVMRNVSSHDDQRLLQYMLLIRGFPAKRNMRHWGAKSFGATRFTQRTTAGEGDR
jgi:type IV secretion system protein VirB3